MLLASRTIRIVPQARAGIVERLGRYARTLDAGLTIIVPFVDRLKPLIDLREQVVSFPPQPVITEDNLVVQIDTVIYFTVTDAKSVTYEVANPLQAIEQLTVTTLRNVIGGMTLEQTLTSRDTVNGQLRAVLDEATGKWGIRVNRVELKSVDPPGTIQEAMEKQMRAERDRRAAILTAEGTKQSAGPHRRGREAGRGAHRRGPEAGGDPPLRGRGARRSRPCSARSTPAAPTRGCSRYQYLQMLPQIAQGDSNKIWVIPSEFTPGARPGRQRLRARPGRQGRRQLRGRRPRRPAAPAAGRGRRRRGERRGRGRAGRRRRGEVRPRGLDAGRPAPGRDASGRGPRRERADAARAAGRGPEPPQQRVVLIT